MVEAKQSFVSVLRNRSFLFLWIGQVVSQLSANTTLFLLGLLVYKHTESNAAVSGLFIVWGIPSVLFGMIAGAMVDKIERKQIVVWSNIVRAILVVGMVFVTKNILFVYVLLFFHALVTQFLSPAMSTMIPKIVSEEELLTANSLFSFAYFGSMAIGFVMAGPLLRISGPFGSLGILAFLFALAAWLGMFLPKEGDENAVKRILSLDVSLLCEKMWRALHEGITYIFHVPALLDSVLLLTGTQIIFAMLGTLGPGFADKMMGIEVSDASLVIIGPVVLGIICGVIWVGNRGHVYEKDILIKTGIFGAGCMLVAVSSVVYLKRFSGFSWVLAGQRMFFLEICLLFLLGVSNSLLDVPANSVLQQKAEGDMRGRVYGMLGAFVGGIGILPVLIGGILADVIGVGNVILCLGFFIIGYGLFRTVYYHKNGKGVLA